MALDVCQKCRSTADTGFHYPYLAAELVISSGNLNRVATDDGSGDNDGTLQNYTYVSNARSTDVPTEIGSGNSLQFDSTKSQYVDISNSITIGSGDVTLSAWFKSDDITSTSMICDLRDNDGSGCALYFNSDGTVRSRFSTDNAGENSDSSDAYDDGSWHHAAVVCIRSGDMSLFIDGTLQIDTPRSDISAAVNDDIYPDEQFIGARSFGSTALYFSGLIDDVRIYDSALSKTDVASLSQNNYMGSPVGHWKFDENNYVNRIWSNKNYIRGNDTLESTVDLTHSGDFSKYLITRSFDLPQIPRNAVIRGIEIQVEKSGQDGISDGSAYLEVSGSFVGSDHKATGIWDTNTTTYGSSTDLWGYTEWSPGLVNEKDSLGFGFSAEASAGSGTVWLNSVNMKVHYEHLQNEAGAVSYVNKFGNTHRIQRTTSKPSIGAVEDRYTDRFETHSSS